MLKQVSSKTLFLITYLLTCSIQLFAAFNFQLFGDEAFYWLEGQHLAWSYSEIPGWTPWTHTLMGWLFPQHPLFIRLPSLIAAFGIPWIGIHISKLLTSHQGDDWVVGLLLLTLPILGLAGILAVPDIWIMFFTLLAFAVLLQAIVTHQTKSFVLLGLILALGINVHIRFWLVVLITGIVVLWQFKNHKIITSKLLKFILPLVLLGLIPILIFNFQHEFPLLSFQLKDRHPWEFQASHFSFFLIQIIITTPWVFYLCLKNMKLSVMHSSEGDNRQQTVIKSLTYVAVIHWLIYALVGFFSDTLRLNVHWTLLSYALLLLTTAVHAEISMRLKRWAVITGVLANLSFLITLNYWLIWQHPMSSTNAQITNHASGWQQLAEFTDNLLIQENTQHLVVDHFMTLAQLKFYSKQAQSFTTSDHPLNLKHGRDKQLKIVGLALTETKQENIFLVEHSALKLSEAIDYYQSVCLQLNGIQLIDSLDINQGLKTYHYFKTGTNNQACDIPPLVYYEYQDNVISGWILQQNNGATALRLYDANNQQKLAKEIRTNAEPLGSNSIFNNLNPAEYELLTFNISHTSSSKQTLQLMIERQNQNILSQRIINWN